MSDTQFLKDNLSGSVPTEIAESLIKNLVSQSVAFNVCRHETMTSDKKVLPMLTDEGAAHWVGEGEKIGTSMPTFEYPTLQAKKLAVIIPFTKEKLHDSAISVIGELESAIKDAFIKAIDKAVFFGTNSPFATNIITEASKANAVNGTGKIDLDISEAMSKVEANDLAVNAIITHNGMKHTMRTLRDSSGNALVIPGGASGSQIYNTNIFYPANKSWDKSQADILLGDFNRAVIGTREGIEYEILKEATVGEINLAENDLIAIKCTMRFGFVVVDSKAFSVVKPKVD